MAFILTAAALTLKACQDDRAERQFIQRAFAQYVSPAVVKRIAADRGQLRLGGEVRTVTYVFTDLEGFTSLSEQLEPEQVADLLNTYLDGVCDLFVDHGATIDKIIGGAVTGFFGAPDAVTGVGERAIKLLLSLDQFGEAFRQSRNAEGIAFGGTRICISETVRTEMKDVVFRPIGDIVLKGKSEAVSCFQPLPAGAPEAELSDAYDAAFTLLCNCEQQAEAAFKALVKSNPTDPRPRRKTSSSSPPTVPGQPSCRASASQAAQRSHCRRTRASPCSQNRDR